MQTRLHHASGLFVYSTLSGSWCKLASLESSCCNFACPCFQTWVDPPLCSLGLGFCWVTCQLYLIVSGVYWIRRFTGTLAAAMAVNSGYLMSPESCREEKMFPSDCWGHAAALRRWEQVLRIWAWGTCLPRLCSPRLEVQSRLKPLGRKMKQGWGV